MKGWKTLSGGLLSILYGLWRVYEGDTDIGGQAIINGLAIIGIGHKLDKLGA